MASDETSYALATEGTGQEPVYELGCNNDDDDDDEEEDDDVAGREVVYDMATVTNGKDMEPTYDMATTDPQQTSF
jgi:hypothetical protein